MLLGREEELIRQGEALDQQLLDEQRVAGEHPTQAGFIYAPFAKNNRHGRDLVNQLLVRLRVEIEQAREQLAEAYRQLKVMEEVRKERVRQERVVEARKEQAVYDEIGQTQFRLHRK